MRTPLLPFMIFAALLLAGCAGSPSRNAGEFLALQEDPRVLYETGADDYARQVSLLLPTAVSRVQAAHYREFAAPVTVHVCGSPRCFGEHVSSRNVSAATVPDNRVFLSPNLFGPEAHRLDMILTHELSHLHLGQQIGHFSPSVPVWFHEGLAAHASGGGGADYASNAEARAALMQGQMFSPTARDRNDFRHRAEFWGLSTYMFYRQAMMFIDHLKNAGESKFRSFLLRVQDQEDFEQSFTATYGMTLSEAGGQFLRAMAAPVAPADPIQAASAP